MMAGEPNVRFVLCLRNDSADDLEPRKVYQALPDAAAARESHVRVIDESGEDYLYPTDYFVPLKLPISVARKLIGPSKPASSPARSRSRAVRA